MIKRLWKCLCILCLVPLLLTGCWDADPDTDGGPLLPEGSQETESTETKVILPASFSLSYAPDQTLDPITCADGMQQTVGALLYEGLFALDTSLEPQPMLCTTYTYDAATYTYVFTLRTDATFSDGTALTPADVTATLQRARSSDRYGARFSQVASITTGSNSVTITLHSANSGFPALLDIPIVKSGTEQSLVPIGTGPYYLQTDETGASLAENPFWWDERPLPVDRISLLEAEDSNLMLYQFTSHDTQLITADLTGSNSISATGNVSFQDADTTVLQYLGFNTRRAPFDDAAVRRALGMGINRNTIVDAFLSGHAAEAQFPVSPVCSLYPQSLDQTYSYQTFSTAMEAAGCNTGNSRTVTLLVNEENSFKVSVANYLAETLSEFDLQLEVKTLPWEQFCSALESGNFDMYYGETRLTADWNCSSLVATGGALNYGGWSDPQLDALLTAYAGASDRATALQELCAYLQETAPILPICFKSTTVLMQTGVIENLTPTAANPFFDFPSCTISLQE